MTISLTRLGDAVNNSTVTKMPLRHKIVVLLSSIFSGTVSLSLHQTEPSSLACERRTQHLADPPYQNYFYSDCNVDVQAVVTSPLPDSDPALISPRFIVAWPAGNSGVCTFFKPRNGVNGSLAIELVNSTAGDPLGPVHREEPSSKYPFVGVEGVLRLNDSAELTLSILGSIRNIRDYTEGGGLLTPAIQEGVRVRPLEDGGVQISRTWLDNATTTRLTLVPHGRPRAAGVRVEGQTVRLEAGQYHFSTDFNYPQLTQLAPQQILNKASQSLIEREPAQVSSLSFFSYSEKLLAGGWRFLTYFGRDSMITALLLQPVLSSGQSSAMEAVLGAALERVNRSDGAVCHEETIGDYATLTNMRKGIASTAALFDYHMIDSDFFLPILMDRYFRASPSRIRPLLATRAGIVNLDNKGLDWGVLGYATARRIMRITAAFAENPTVANLIRLNDGLPVGQWRDSSYGLAGGRIPFDVNCALVPAALYAIASLAATPGVFPSNDETRAWRSLAAKRAKLWEDRTLPFFRFKTPVDEAASLLRGYVRGNVFYDGPTHEETLARHSTDGAVVDYALAIESVERPEPIRISHTDTGFRNFLLSPTDDRQLTSFLNASANAILRPFPAGLSTPVGALVANPALSGNKDFIAGFSNSAYHGAVVWSWQLALVAKGFEQQLDRCPLPGSRFYRAKPRPGSKKTRGRPPAFCKDRRVYKAVRRAYNHLWDSIDANKDQLQSEVWSWTYAPNATDARDGFRVCPLGVLPPPPGASAPTESDVRQLWSLAFLAIERNGKYN
ncbi:hypothetical protein CDD83_6555 [Cordyceps sp. RAO-2017]|nr:hypothetical protein CDD83_6555 [Cordyceps sp. RAO-2017]